MERSYIIGSLKRNPIKYASFYTPQDDDEINYYAYIYCALYHNHLEKNIKYHDKAFYKYLLNNKCQYINDPYNTSDPRHIKNIPINILDKELCYLFLAKDPKNIQYLPDTIIDFEMCIYVINTKVCVIQHIPKNFLTYELYLLAMNNNYMSIYHIPKEFITREMCYFIRSSDHIPKEILDYDLCLHLVKKSYIIDSIPEEFRTYEMWVQSIKHHGSHIRYYPGKINYELCNIAINNNHFALDDIPKVMRTYELCYNSVRIDGETMKYVPKKLITKEMCIMVSKQDMMESPYSLIPEKYIDEDILINIAKSSLYGFIGIHKKHLTEKICLEAAISNPYIIQFIPDEFHNSNFYCDILKKNHLALHQIKEWGKIPIDSTTYKTAFNNEKFTSINLIPINWDFLGDENKANYIIQHKNILSNRCFTKFLFRYSKVVNTYLKKKILNKYYKISPFSFLDECHRGFVVLNIFLFIKN